MTAPPLGRDIGTAYAGAGTGAGSAPRRRPVAGGCYAAVPVRPRSAGGLEVSRAARASR
jgi:hypothetical protein